MAAAAAAAVTGPRPRQSAAAGSRPGDRFFTVARRQGRWWFVTPQDRPFFSIGLNHVDPATMRYAENIHIWREKYGASVERWLKEAVRPDLAAWGFNTVGWVQEVVTRGPTNHRHSRNFTFEEYQWLGVPYCHMLPFADFHQWEMETRHPDLSSRDFEDWCDYVARAHCAQLADDPALIGYFYIDCPTWVHVWPQAKWKGPLFDPARLATEEGKRALSDMATQYYKVTHDAIRRYDRNHLILGDRYEGRAPLPEEVVSAALPYVDVLSFQHFSDPAKIREDFDRWHQATGKPVLLADATRTRKLPDGSLGNDPQWYREALAALRDCPGAVGLHLCGAYLRNRCRSRGLRDEKETPDEEAIRGITQANQETRRWAASLEPPGAP
jgi:hypothetical protein